MSLPFYSLLATLLLSLGVGHSPNNPVYASPSSSILHGVDSSSATEVSMGTTIVAARWGNHTHGGVVLGADSRTSRGTFASNRFANKISTLSDRIVVGRSGSAADSQHLVNSIRRELADLELESGGAAINVKLAAGLVRHHCYTRRDQISVSMLTCGWDDVKGGQIYQVPQGGSLLEANSFAVAGSGSQYITGWCGSAWKHGMTREECAGFVEHALRQAVDLDCQSSPPFLLALLDGTGTERRSLFM